MPTDLLRYLAGPTGYSPWWWLVAGLLMVILVGWYAGVAIWTLPPIMLRSNRLLGGLHRRLVARRFTRSVRATTAAYRSGALSPAQAATAYTRTLRSFLTVATGRRPHYMRVADLANSPLAPAAPLVAALNDIRFNAVAPSAPGDVERLAAAVEGAIAQWI
ncbi:hypothetical protein [Mycolicibacterium komossense]|uniref:DUF4129 domain-containing protein n=1 Tax=Mycolicibacterium komossense TaxID=1779 RepID=A0ABT3CK45_9MYCO|nr:hypothetical protein [Mycolicibacterium komossense]MCV7229858.1 hypothetical protein [Mycolicibacterium komossense]